MPGRLRRGGGWCQAVYGRGEQGVGVVGVGVVDGEDLGVPAGQKGLDESLVVVGLALADRAGPVRPGLQFADPPGGQAVVVGGAGHQRGPGQTDGQLPAFARGGGRLDAPAELFHGRLDAPGVKPGVEPGRGRGGVLVKGNGNVGAVPGGRVIDVADADYYLSWSRSQDVGTHTNCPIMMAGT